MLLKHFLQIVNLPENSMLFIEILVKNIQLVNFNFPFVNWKVFFKKKDGYTKI